MTESEPHSAGDARRGAADAARLLADYEARLTDLAALAARVRHEVNNPLTGMFGQTQLLLREELSESARRRVEVIEQLAGRIRDAVAELRDVRAPVPDAARAPQEPARDEPPRH